MPLSIISTSDIIDRVLMEIPEAPKNLIVARVKIVLIDFCKRTDMWRENFSLVGVQDQEVYIIPHDVSATPLKIHKVERDGIEVPKNYFELIGSTIVFRENFSYKFLMEEGQDFTVLTSMVPNADNIDSEILLQYSQCIIDGAVASLMRMPKRPWTSLGESQFYEKRFKGEVTRALSQIANRGTNKGSFRA